MGLCTYDPSPGKLVSAGRLVPLFTSRSVAVFLVMLAGVAWSTWRRWRTRSERWHMLHDWASRPVRVDGDVVRQHDARGNVTGSIDTHERFSVRWERFDAQRVLYFVTQNDNTIAVSTLAPNARAVLKETLQVANYRCEEWPNLDL